MTASNWTTCPRCLTKAQAEKDKKIEKVKKAYGKVPSDQYEKMLAESRKEVDVEVTFREDWELGVGDDGVFYVIYRGSCQAGGCSFGHQFKHEEKLKL